MSETTTAKKGRKSAEEKAALPALDLTALTVEDAEVPAITRQREEKANPFAGPLLETKAARDGGNEKAGKAVVVPAERAGEVKYLIRQAATKNGIGARIVEEDAGNGNIRIIFSGKEKRTSADEVRAWAKENGKEFPAEGALPKALIDEYRAAKSAENGAAQDAPTE